ncbi:MAG: DUF4124 domain-containing protein, partial [Zetaproteobacteria bacterium]
MQGKAPFPRRAERAWRIAALGALGVLAFASFPIEANEVYQWTDEAGVVHFSDVPRQGARPKATKPLGSTTGPGAARVVEIPFVREDGVMIVRGEACGVPMRWIVDTGASVVVVPPRVAEAARAAPIGRAKLDTAGGPVRAPIVRLCRVR